MKPLTIIDMTDYQGQQYLDAYNEESTNMYSWGDSETALCSICGKSLTLDTCAVDVNDVRWTLCVQSCFYAAFGDSNQEKSDGS